MQPTWPLAIRRDRSFRRLLTLTPGVLVLVYGVTAYIIPPAMYSDCANGFEVWRSMLHGGPFNCSVVPDPADIARDTSYFLTWWSPGQYLVPGAISLIGLRLGIATVLTVFIASVAMLVGWRRAFIELGLSTITADQCCLLFACARFFTLPFGIYTGGEVLSRAVEPWLVVLAIRRRELSYPSILVLVVALLVAVFLKLSMLVFALQLAVFLMLLAIDRYGLKWEFLLPFGARVGCMLIAVGLIVYFGFIAGSRTPASPNSFHFDVTALLSRFSSVGLAGISGGDFLDWILSHPSRPAWHAYRDSPLLLLLLTAITASIVVATWRSSLPRDYKLLCLAALVSPAVLTWMDLFGSDIDSSERHVRFAGLVLVPAWLVFAQGRFRVLGVVLKLLLVMAGIYGLTSWAQRTLSVANHAVIGRSGFRQTVADQAGLDAIHAIDDRLSPVGNSILFVPFEELALEVERLRPMARYVEFASLESLQRLRYHGKVDNLFVVLPAAENVAGKNRAVLDAFENYHSWASVDAGKLRIWYDTQQDIDPSEMIRKGPLQN